MSTAKTAGRRALGEELGGFGVFTATSGSPTTAVLSAFASSELPTDHLAYVWGYCPASILPRLRHVTGIGTNGGTGTVTFDGSFGTAIAALTVVELSAKLPPGSYYGSPSAFGESVVPGLNECLNMALRHLLVDQDDYALSLVTQQRNYTLPAWLDRDDRLVDVRVLDALGGDYVSTDHRWELRPSGKGSTLHFANPFRFSSGSYSAHLVVKRPADTLIKRAGVWIDTTPGINGSLDAETDEAGLEINQLIPVALVFAYRALRDRGRGPTRAIYHALYEAQVRLARGVHNYDHSNEIDPSVSKAPTAPTAEAA